MKTLILTIAACLSILFIAPASAQLPVTDTAQIAALNAQLTPMNITQKQMAQQIAQLRKTQADMLNMMQQSTNINAAFTGMEDGSDRNIADTNSDYLRMLQGDTTTSSQARSIIEQGRRELNQDEVAGNLPTQYMPEILANRDWTTAANFQGQVGRDMEIYLAHHDSVDPMLKKLGTVKDFSSMLTYIAGLNLQNFSILAEIGKSISLNTAMVAQSKMQDARDATQAKDDRDATIKQMKTAPLKTALVAPFTVIDLTYKEAFKLYIGHFIGAISAALSGPLLACVTLWVIIQGVLVMRGDIDARRGVIKLLNVAIIVGIVSSNGLYHDYVQAFFEDAVPHYIADLGGTFGLPGQIGGSGVDIIPLGLDMIFNAGQIAFTSVQSELGEANTSDALAFEGAQFFFYFSLWSIFGIYHITMMLTMVLVAIGPLFIIGFLFESTSGMASRWIGQLASYAILLLLVSIVATIVVTVIVAGMATITFVVLSRAGPLAGQIIGLYELDLFIMTGSALVAALPTIAATIGGGVGPSGGQIGSSIYRRFAKKPNDATIRLQNFTS